MNNLNGGAVLTGDLGLHSSPEPANIEKSQSTTIEKHELQIWTFILHTFLISQCLGHDPPIVLIGEERRPLT